MTESQIPSIMAAAAAGSATGLSQAAKGNVAIIRAVAATVLNITGMPYRVVAAPLQAINALDFDVFTVVFLSTLPFGVFGLVFCFLAPLGGSLDDKRNSVWRSAE